jgi:hypothetical protein
MSFELLTTVARACETPAQQRALWEILSVNFVVMCLHTKQLPRTIGGMAGLLGESVWEGGLGARGVCEEDGVQDPVGLVLDKLSVNLVEEPRTGADKPEVPPPRSWC